MSPDLVSHYEARLRAASDLYERTPSAESSWALVRALAQARLHRVQPTTYDSIITALGTNEIEILEAALDCALAEDYAAAVENFAARADHAVEEWEDQIDGFVILHFELQAAHDWLADRILMSEALVPHLIHPLERLGSSIHALSLVIKRHESLFHIGEALHSDLLKWADPSLLTSAYKLAGMASSHASDGEGARTGQPEAGRTIPFVRPDRASSKTYARAAGPEMERLVMDRLIEFFINSGDFDVVSLHLEPELGAGIRPDISAVLYCRSLQCLLVLVLELKLRWSQDAERQRYDYLTYLLSGLGSIPHEIKRPPALLRVKRQGDRFAPEYHLPSDDYRRAFPSKEELEPCLN